jgi:hypothetical protein
MDGSRRIIGLATLGCLAFGLRVWAAFDVPPDWLAVHHAGLAVQLLQCLAGTALVLAVAWLGWALVPEQSSIGWTAALAAAIYPGHIHAAIDPQFSLWAALAVTALLAFALSPRRQSGRRVAILVGTLVAIIACWATVGWLWGQGAGDASGGYAQLCLLRLRGFLLPEATSAAVGQPRLDRFAAIACLVLAMLGVCASGHRWRSLWPTYLLVAVIVLAHTFGFIAALSRMPLEPIAMIWAALAVTPPLARLFTGGKVRVYRPGELEEDPFSREHILRGPHFDVKERRRAG